MKNEASLYRPGVCNFRSRISVVRRGRRRHSCAAGTNRDASTNANTGAGLDAEYADRHHQLGGDERAAAAGRRL
jgi:hypothetical protein